MKRFWLNWETGGANGDKAQAVRDMLALRQYCDGAGWITACEVLCAGGSEMAAIAKVEEESAEMGLPSAKYWITR